MFVVPSEAKAFIEIPEDHPFPIQNMPYGIFDSGDGVRRVGVALGDLVLDLAACAREGLLQLKTVDAQTVFGSSTLNAFLALGRDAWTETRRALFDLLQDRSSPFSLQTGLRTLYMHDRESVHMHLPATIGDYTDFYSSREHATNVGTMFRGAENALMPNWLHLPVGYHGRASSIVPSGTPVRRPLGQQKPDDAPPVFGPSRLLDFELELGFIIGKPSKLGESISTASAEDHIFGFVLVNDWSARDIQKWEYVPLGPFLGKNFATTISPWIVPMDALSPFRRPGPKQDPVPLPYLRSEQNWGLDISLEVAVLPEGSESETTICRSNARHLYWSAAQQLAHHTIGGCNVNPGDLMASGTISGGEPSSFGSLLELTWRGTKPLELNDGQSYRFIADGDSIVMRGWAQGNGFRVGFGEAEGTVLPAHSDD